MNAISSIKKQGNGKKILTIAPYTFLPANSGGQRAIYYLDQHLGMHSDLLCISTNENDTSYMQEPLHFRLLPTLGSGIRRYINPLNLWKVKKLIRSNDIQTIVIEHPYMGWLGWLLKITMGIPLVVRSHNIEALRFKELGKWWWRILADYERWVHKKASHSFFITQEDADYAVKTYGINPADTSVITYGIESLMAPTPEQKLKAATSFKEKYQIDQRKTLLLFNGIFGYAPNDSALQLLIEEIIPELLATDPSFHLILCGKNIAEKFIGLKNESITVLGFVEDIQEVFLAAEIFLNPIWQGGGIKTKLVEALAKGSAAVSFESGAIGIDPELLEGKLKLVPNLNTQLFIEAVQEVKSAVYKPTPKAFLDYFDWDQIARKALYSIRGL
ncbi:Glycosyltransferase Family 4 [Arachidicoccus rhizosphaerae]|uniref:Glycosyltransferase Family 4 n=1 Tax=Arachidicoccus rhizosphaerae TaxID=551991 RepID=A0A1H4C3G0_9BACT|nr:glycosyltransferase family 4 protein [Arachidicoccus rhizosphaerae]SEA54867.1 Glycosyltransferase Family 4 [Arachidicoccus rhizosphaerae]